MFHIWIDYRETDLMAECQRLKEQYEQFAGCTELKYTNLHIGDIVITHEPVDGSATKPRGKEYLIIERKTVADLMASIKDGRYEEQSYRLRGSGHPWHNIIYLVEGSPDITGSSGCKLPYRKGAGTNNTTSKFTFYSALFSLNYQKGFSVMRSTGLTESAFLLLNAWYKLTMNAAKKHIVGGGAYDGVCAGMNANAPVVVAASTEEAASSAEDNNEEETPTTTHSPIPAPELPQSSYTSVIKRHKKENITAENIHEIMLCQIPNVSPAVAAAVMASGPYKTVTDLSLAIRANPACLDGVTIMTASGKMQKVRKPTIATLVEYLG